MSDTIWISTAPGHASNMRPLRNDVAEADSERLQAIVKRREAGEPLGRDELPSAIFGAPHAQEKDFRLPDLFYGYGYWIVSSEAADVLRQFDLGRGGLYPVEVLKSDRQTAVEGEWFCLDFGNRKEALLPEQSARLKTFPVDRWAPPFVTKDGMVAVAHVATQGADIWVDPLLTDAFFLGAGLGKALKKAKADKGFFLARCRVI